MTGLFELIAIPFGYVMKFAYMLTHNYLLAILLFTLVMEIILSPIAIKQQKNQIKQARLAPKVAAIRKKYAGRNDQATQQKMQQETMDMYQQENFNPMGGCLPLLIQLPIITALYFVVQQPLTYLCNIPKGEIEALANLLNEGLEKPIYNVGAGQLSIINAIKDNIADYFTVAPSLKGADIPNLTVFGLDFSKVPSLTFSPFDWLMLIPIITFFVMVLSTKIMQKFSYRDPMTEEQQNNPSMKIMTWTMPLLSVFFEFQFAAAIGIYWIFRNVVQVIVKIVIAKLMPLPVISKEEYEEEERKANMSNKQKKREALQGRGDRPFVRSLHHIDDEDYIARHAEELKALEEEKNAQRSYTPKFGLGKTTAAKDAPAPIKNDEKATYEEKSEDKKD